MKNVLEKEATESLISEEQETVHASRPTQVSWPSSFAEDEMAMRGTGGLLPLNAAIIGAGPRSRGQVQDANREHAPEAFATKEIPVGKRAFDVVFAFFALLFALPVMLACAIAIRMESDGPILFRQRRMGQGGSPFFIFKFRTMVPDAESVLASYLASHPEAQREWDADHKLRNDPRVTMLGRTMRMLSLDELPQFWNVLRGEMSIVGPRPIVQAEVAKYEEGFRDYCSVRPGITGLWQVSGRNDIGYAERVALDRQYAKFLSPQMDGEILLRTVKAVLSAAGSY